MSEILTPKQVQECSDYYFVSPLARSHETLRAERDRLAAEHARLREALERIADMAMTAAVEGAPPLSGYRVRQIVGAALGAIRAVGEKGR